MFIMSLLYMKNVEFYKESVLPAVLNSQDQQGIRILHCYQQRAHMDVCPNCSLPGRQDLQCLRQVMITKAKSAESR